MSLEEQREFTFLWEIEKFSFCTQKYNESLDSPVFIADSLDGSWYMRLYPRGRKNSDEGWMGCFLRRCENDDGPTEIKCELEIQVIGAKGIVLHSKRGTRVFTKGINRGWINFWKKSIELNEIHDVLKMRCNLKTNSQKKPLRSESQGTTEISIDKSSFEWVVKNLNSSCSEVMKFPYTGTYQVEISIQVPDDDVKITISRVKGAAKTLSVLCGITLIDLQGGKHDSRQASHFFDKEDPSNENDVWEFPNFLKKSKINSDKEKYLENDCFVLKCEIAISNGKQVNSVEKKTCDSSAAELSNPDTGIQNVLEGMKRLYRDKFHADVKLLVGDRIIHAHKNILSIQSPVFLAMFDTDMVENKSGSVVIPDLKAETVNSLLEYMYTGTLEVIDYESASQLIIAADKYQVLCLKEKCARFLISLLSHANVCEVLFIADCIQHDVLKVASLHYIKDNSEAIFYSAEWKNVVEKNLDLAIETVCKVSKCMADDHKNSNDK